MKYRRFTHNELLTLEPEFVRFLALNGIPADEWVRIKTTDDQKVEELIEQFSDAIFERTLRELEYLEFHEPKDIKTFHCQKEKIVLVGLILDGESEFDFTTPNSLEPALQKMRKGELQLKVYTAEKGYRNGDREAELFRMIENGASISKDGKLYKALALQLENN